MCTDASVFLQDAELVALEGTNVSVCVEIELTGELLTDIELTFVTLSGGAGAGNATASMPIIIPKVGHVPPPHGQHTHIDAEDVVQLQQGAVFNASDNVQSGDVACVTLSVVDDDILEPPVEFLVLFEASPDVTVPVESPDFTRVFVMDTTAQGIH